MLMKTAKIRIWHTLRQNESKWIFVIHTCFAMQEAAKRTKYAINCLFITTEKQAMQLPAYS